MVNHKMNREWEKCKAENRPYFEVRRRRKYSIIHYDFLTAKYNLTKEGQNKLFELWREYVASHREYKGLDNILAGFGTIIFFPVLKQDVEIMLPKIKQIIQSNVEPIPRRLKVEC